MIAKPDDLPSDLASALAALQAEREARLRAEAVAASARAELSDNAALIAHLELRIEKLKRELYGQRSERTARLIEQLELELEELATTASEDELAAQAAAAKTQNVRPFTRKRPVRKPWPDDIEHERVVIDAPTSCACCGGSRLAKIGEDVTETLEEIPRRFKVIETVREKFTCRDCEKISQPPAPFHATPRGFIGPQLLATILFDKFGMHIPLNRQSARFKAERIDAGGSGRPRDLRRHAALPPDRASCARCRASAWRRHHHPHPGQEQVHDRADLDLSMDGPRFARPFALFWLTIVCSYLSGFMACHEP